MSHYMKFKVSAILLYLSKALSKYEQLSNNLCPFPNGLNLKDFTSFFLIKNHPEVLKF